MLILLLYSVSVWALFATIAVCIGFMVIVILQTAQVNKLQRESSVFRSRYEFLSQLLHNELTKDTEPSSPGIDVTRELIVTRLYLHSQIAIYRKLANYYQDEYHKTQRALPNGSWMLCRLSERTTFYKTGIERLERLLDKFV